MSTKRKRSQASQMTPRKKRAYGAIQNQTVPRLARYPSFTEYKVTDVASGGLGAVTAAGTIVNCLASLTRGTDYLNQFTGGRITPVGVQLRLGASVGDPTNFLRVLVFQWMDSAPPVLNGLLQGAPPRWNSPLLLTNRENISVLHDSFYKSSVTSPGGSNVFDTPNKVTYIKGKRMVSVEFPSGAVIPQKGGLYMLLLTDSVVPPNPGVDYYIRTTYTDS